MIEGGCLCGKIRYEIDGAIFDISHCHCSMCRKIHGAAFATFGTVQRKNFRWLCGEESIAVYRSSAKMERMFCLHCGSSLLIQEEDEPDVDYVALGTVDGDPGCRPEFHIWVGSKAPWHTITDKLPQFEASED